MEKRLENQLIGTTDQIDGDRASYLKRMNQDVQFKIGDFIPYFGEWGYKERTVKYLFEFLSDERPTETVLMIDKIKKGEDLLEHYNNILMVLTGIGVIFGIGYLSKS